MVPDVTKASSKSVFYVVREVKNPKLVLDTKWAAAPGCQHRQKQSNCWTAPIASLCTARQRLERYSDAHSAGCDIYIVSGNKNPIIILDSNEFSIYSKGASSTRWRCSSYFRSKCRAKLVTFGNVVQTANEHNHPANSQRAWSSIKSQRVTIVRK
ncbi:hypothetical protein D910_12466 [Dendroctonus ponderosae]|uniref:FLYWCH-type domain-containing protein n=1 Tax=Dendroctonus ponderosae TaxID=77166 RepID=U4URQ3_DENPD|nr:hypothetical protein D910_12466 [Dendroctonus ponderosae]